MVEGGAKFIKYLLFAFNLLFFLAGLALFILAIVVQNQINEYANFFGGNNVAVGLIVIGCIIMIITFWGCCGAYKENYCMVLTFGILLTIVLIMKIIFVIIVYTKRDEVISTIDDDITKSLVGYKNSSAVQQTWNAAQVDFKCCGANNYTDWNKVLSGNVPDSCCLTISAGCGKGLASLPKSAVADNIYTDGCIDNVENYVSGNLLLLGSVVISLILVQVIGLILAAWLAHAIRKEYQVM
jgi:CD63 antigen